MSSFPHILTARILRNFGFTWGEDFKVIGGPDNESVVAFQGRAHMQAAYNADQIESGFLSAGMRVNVNFTRTPSGGFHTLIAPSGDRQRQGHFMDTYADRLALGLIESPDRTAEDAFPVGTKVCTIDHTYTKWAFTDTLDRF